MLTSLCWESTLHREIRISFEYSSSQSQTFSNVYPTPFKILASSRHMNAWPKSVGDFLKSYK